MRRLGLVMVLFLAACLPVTPVPQATQVQATARPSPTASARETPAGFGVVLHPDGPLFVGDQVSITVLVPADGGSKDYDTQVSFGAQPLGTERFEPQGLSGRREAILPWAWNTSQLAPGPYSLQFTIRPDGPSWNQTVTLVPAADLPPDEAGAHWASATSACCILNYITGTAAERDIESLKQLADAQAADVAARMQARFREKIPVTFMPRTLGQGGFTDRGIYVSYLDRNYAGSTTAIVLHHEMVHWLDGELAGDLRPTIFAEGLAVYITGGHFKPEPLFPRASALLESGGYIPLRQLADDFYPSQHETGYLEAAALTGYLITTYGWGPFNDFYRNIHPAPGDKQSEAIDAALQARLHLSFDQLERDYQTFLRGQTVDDAVRTDLRLSISFYDAVRRYQQMLDPSAYYLTAWLPDGAVMRQRGIVADYLRHPDSAVNIGMESVLVDADRELRAGHYAQVENLLRGLNVMLDLLDSQGP